MDSGKLSDLSKTEPYQVRRELICAVTIEWNGKAVIFANDARTIGIDALFFIDPINLPLFQESGYLNI